jgi:hypothetical protein
MHSRVKQKPTEKRKSDSYKLGKSLITNHNNTGKNRKPTKHDKGNINIKNLYCSIIYKNKKNELFLSL